MKINCQSILFLASLVAVVPIAEGGQSEGSLSDYIRPLVGTADGEGNTFPGPSAPFGMVQISPDTDSVSPIGTRAPVIPTMTRRFSVSA